MGEAGSDRVTLLEARQATHALEVETTTSGPAAIELLDDYGNVVAVVKVVDNRPDIMHGNNRPDHYQWSAVANGPADRQPVRVFYDSGICEVFTSTGTRSEILYDGRAIRTVVVRELSPSDLGGTGEQWRAQAWELADIWASERGSSLIK